MQINEHEQTLYEILQVSPTATLKEIKKAYRKRCLEYHPDVNPETDSRACHEIMCKINEAYGILRDAESRKAYDEKLKRQYYCSNEVSKSDKQSNNSDTKSASFSKSYQKSYDNEDPYEYYNSVDFDKDMQEEFINWMESYVDSYRKYVYMYYQKYKISKNDDDLFERLCNLFLNNINVEKTLLKKTNKINSLRL